MKKEKNQERSQLEQKIVDNIRKIMIEKKFTQAAFADYMGISAGQFSKILSGTHGLSFLYLERLARALSINEIDIMTYPEVYVSKNKAEQDSFEAILQIKLTKDKKDQVLNLVLGEKYIEILNK